MKKSFKSMVAVGAVALVAGQVSADTMQSAGTEATKTVNSKFKSSLVKPAPNSNNDTVQPGSGASDKEWQGE